MSATINYSPFRPELVAKKLNLIRNFEHPEILDEITARPRLTEVLWFLTFVSRNENYAGGLRKFSTDLIAESADLLGTAAMQAHGNPPYPEALRQTFYEEIPSPHRWDFGLGADSDFEDWSMEPLFDEHGDSSRQDGRSRRADAADKARNQKANSERRGQSMNAGFAQRLREIAIAELPQYLLNLCERSEVHFTRAAVPQPHLGGERAPWYFVRVADAVLRFIDRRKSEVAASIAQTAISREIFHWLAKARATDRSIIISGHSRHGKSEPVRAWAAMNPGLARIVETPASGGEGELLRAVAKALGIETGVRQRGHDLRGEIEFVLQQFRPLLIFEEASFLYPATFSKNTMPARLNWVRRSVMDCGIPCAFVWTPQTHRDARNRFSKATNFAIEQFDGRILRTVNLPVEISREDLLAIARIHFPGLDERYCEYVVSKAAATERNYCSDVSNIAALARSNAEDAGRAMPNFEDIKAAIADVLPTAAEVPETSAPRKSRSRPESPLQVACKPRETRPLTDATDVDSAAVEHERISPLLRANLSELLPT